MDEDVEVGKESILRVLNGVLEVRGKAVDVGEEGFGVVGVTSSPDSIVDEVLVEVERIGEGVEGVLLHCT